MANQYRGELNATLDGKQWTLCLTLGALAELETHFKVEGLGDLAKCLSEKSLSSNDFLAIIYAGLKGGGHCVEISELAEMRIEGGASAYAKLVADLLNVTFGTAPDSQERLQEASVEQEA